MRRSTFLTALVIAAAATAVLTVAVPQAEASCQGRCVLVSFDPICFKCVDAGYETGALCAQQGPCGCYFIQCAALQGLQSSDGDQVVLAANQSHPDCGKEAPAFMLTPEQAEAAAQAEIPEPATAATTG